MIQRKPQNRLGAIDGVSDVKNHPWLKDFPWVLLNEKKLKAPFTPPNEDNFDQKNINEEWRDVEDDDFKESYLSLHRQSTQNMFSGYYYDVTLAQLATHREFRDSSITK